MWDCFYLESGAGNGIQLLDGQGLDNKIWYHCLRCVDPPLH